MTLTSAKSLSCGTWHRRFAVSRSAVLFATRCTIHGPLCQLRWLAAVARCGSEGVTGCIPLQTCACQRVSQACSFHIVYQQRYAAHETDQCSCSKRLGGKEIVPSGPPPYPAPAGDINLCAVSAAPTADRGQAPRSKAPSAASWLRSLTSQRRCYNATAGRGLLLKWACSRGLTTHARRSWGDRYCVSCCSAAA